LMLMFHKYFGFSPLFYHSSSTCFFFFTHWICLMGFKCIISLWKVLYLYRVKLYNFLIDTFKFNNIGIVNICLKLCANIEWQSNFVFWVLNHSCCTFFFLIFFSHILFLSPMLYHWNLPKFMLILHTNCGSSSLFWYWSMICGHLFSTQERIYLFSQSKFTWAIS
jgi:hypothetical protein